MTSRSSPDGGSPYAPDTSSSSVPSTPTESTSTSNSPASGRGSGISTSRSLPGFPGVIVTALIVLLTSMIDRRPPSAFAAHGHG
jgi:hypothetical protein